MLASLKKWFTKHGPAAAREDELVDARTELREARGRNQDAVDRLMQAAAISVDRATDQTARGFKT